MPLFSIVIPTRNRVRLLKSTLKSSLEQTFDDYEIVVSDNNSSDSTPEVVQDIDDEKVRYFRTNRSLSMTDSFEFALNNARGEWVTFLNDKSVFDPRLLEILKTLIDNKEKVIGWCWNFYHYNTYYDIRKRNQLMIYPYTSIVKDINAKSQLDKLFALGWWDRTQLFLVNACYHRSIINEVKRRCGQFMFSPIGDLSSSAAVLSVIEKYIHLDFPLTLIGGSSDGTTASFDRRNETFWNFINELQKDNLFNYVPLQILTKSNFYSESLLKVKHTMKDFPSDVQLDWKQYYVSCYNDLLHLEQHGIDVSMEKRQFFTELSKRPLDFQVYVRRHKPSTIIRRGARSVIDRWSVLKYFESLIRKNRVTPLIVHGRDEGFNNILEASCYHQKLLAKDYSKLLKFIERRL